MDALVSVIGWFCLIFGAFWLFYEIRQQIEDRRAWKQMELNFRAKRKEHNERILKAFEKTIESEDFQKYLVSVFREKNEKAKEAKKESNFD